MKYPTVEKVLATDDINRKLLNLVLERPENPDRNFVEQVYSLVLQSDLNSGPIQTYADRYFNYSDTGNQNKANENLELFLKSITEKLTNYIS